jgi:uncharacterized short protein YbdD (DUF466 family)
MATAALQRFKDAGASVRTSTRTSGRSDANQKTRWHRAKTFARGLWRGIRDWCGDSAYERYLVAARKKDSANCAQLTEEQFYVEQLNRRYSRPNRCC